MATFAELIYRVEDILKGPGVFDDVPSLINQGVDEIAGGMLSSIAQNITPPLPELLIIKKVATDPLIGFVPMPTDFQRNLQFVVDANDREIDIAHSFFAFNETDPSFVKPGRINEVIEHGRMLYYLNVPEVSEELTLHYYRFPVAMVNDEDRPDGLPMHTHYALLVNFALWKAFEFIESGTEDDFSNTQKYKSLFEAAMSTFELSIPDHTRGFFLR